MDLSLILRVAHYKKLSSGSDLLLSHYIVTDGLVFESSPQVTLWTGPLLSQKGLQSFIGYVRRLRLLVQGGLSLVLNSGVLVKNESEGIIARVLEVW